MKTKIIFYSQIQIKRYAQKLNQNQRFFYSVLKKEKWFFLTRYTVLFYNEESIQNTISKVFHDLVSNEYGIKVHNLVIKIRDHDHIHVDTTTNNHALLIGKLGKNHNSIEKFLSRVVSFAFFHKWKVTCKINKSTKGNYTNSKTPNVKQNQQT